MKFWVNQQETGGVSLGLFLNYYFTLSDLYDRR